MDTYREGFLNKAGKGVLQTRLHSWRPRYFVLEGSSLKYYKVKENTDENLLGCIELSDIDCVSLMKNEKHSFQISTKSRTYYMSGKSDDEVMGWINVIQMAKANLEKRDAIKNTSHDDYDEVKPFSEKSPKVVRSEYSVLSGVGGTGDPIRSEYVFVDASPDTNTKNGDDVNLPTYDKPDKVFTSQSEAPNQTSVKKVESRDTARAADSTGCDDDESLLQEDPTYEIVLTNQSEASKRTSVKKVNDVYEDPNSSEKDTADLYDTLLDVNAGKSSDVQILPPPLPMRPSSLSEIPNCDLTFPVIAVYDKVGLAEGESSKEGNEEEAKKKSESVEADGADEKKISLPVYAKPVRKPKSLKRTVNPAMMDIGEVSNDVEKECSGGAEILKMGMTQPIGNLFACEELKELLNKYNEEDNNNDNMSGRSEVKMADFDVDQDGSSAFDVLKRFLEKH